MPLYVYKCEVCNHEFEELVSYAKKDDPRDCPKCGKDSRRLEVTPFGVSVKADKNATLVSPKEIDKAVGVDADKRWNFIETRRKQRWAGRKPKEIEVPKGNDGLLKPVEILGTQQDKNFRREFSTALSAHRAERQKKGIGQFDGPGAIDERD